MRTPFALLCSGGIVLAGLVALGLGLYAAITGKGAQRLDTMGRKRGPASPGTTRLIGIIATVCGLFLMCFGISLAFIFFMTSFAQGTP